jgi:DNA adenine methylase
MKETLNVEKKPQPFLKWAGGKSQLLQQFDSLFPSTFNQYIEPFLGGGAVFFYLYSKDRIKKAVLLDSNRELIYCYKTIKNNLVRLISRLKNHKRRYQQLQEEYYYHIRNRIRNNLKRWNNLSVSNRSAITIFLNKTCFNGLYRVNRDNQFNVPVGRYNNPEIYDPDNLKAVNQALKIAKIKDACDFSECLKYARKDDFVYLDPPYNPLNGTSNFTSYTKQGFGEREQIRLSEVFRKLDKRRCMVMLSNSDTDFIKKLYNGYRIETVKAVRAINCKSAGRGRINELVVLNY